jgi:hypothetical protein
MSCPEKIRLAAAYQARTTEFAEAVSELQRVIGTAPQARFQRLQLGSDEARLKSEQARLELELHIASHRC